MIRVAQGERRYHPYKIWCDEIQRQRGKRECFEDGEEMKREEAERLFGEG